jgi:GT2 family glycosyltransferase
VSSISDVACIIVAFNSVEVIDGCLSSLLDSGIPPANVYLVDNSSTDGTADHVSQNYPEITVIRSPENLGFSKANNLGANRGSSEVLLFANPDLIFLPGAVEELTGHLTSYPETGLCGPLLVDRDLRPRPESYLLPHTVPGLLLVQTYLWRPLFSLRALLDRTLKPTSPRRRTVLSGACLAVRRKDFLRVGSFDEDLFMYAEEYELCHRMREAGLGLVQAPRAKVVHLGGGSYTAGSRALFFHSLRSRDTFFVKHSGGGALVAKRVLTALGLLLRYGALRLRRSTGSGEDPATRLWEGLRPYLSSGILTREPLDFPPG